MIRGGDDIHRHGVVPAVIAALELDEVPTSGDRSGKTHRWKGCFPAIHGKRHALNRGDVLHDLLSQLDLYGADANAHVVQACAGFCHRAIDIRIVVPEQGWTERGMIVREGPAAVIGEGRATRGSNDQIIEARHLALRAVDAAGDYAPGASRSEEHTSEL